MDRTELEMLDIETLDARKEELRGMVDEPEADLDAIEKEVDIINELRSAKIAERETRKSEMKEVIEGLGEEIEKEEKRSMDNMEIRNTKEYIEAYAKYIKTGKDAECRALLTENASGTVPVPEIVESRVRTAWERDGITSRVRKSYLKGNLKVGFEISGTDASIHTEGAAAPSEETLVLGIVELVPQSIKKWISISDEVLDMTATDFLNYIYDELTYRIAKKAADTVIAKIDACGTASTSTQVGVALITSSTATLTLVAECVANLSDEAENPVVIINKQTYADFKSAQATANYAYDPFEGLEVVFNNSLKARSAASSGDTWMIVGDLDGVQMNFPAGEEIDFKFDDLSLAEKDLVKIVGRMYAGIGVTAPFAFCKVEA